MMKEFYVFKNEISNEYLGIDNSSGGYPYLTKDILDAFKSLSLNEAMLMSRRREELLNDPQSYLKYEDRSYFEKFPSYTKNLKLIKVTMREESI